MFSLCLRQPLTVHLQSVGLKKFLVAISMTGIIAHVSRGHLGDVQRAVISKVLPVRESEGEKKQTLIDLKQWCCCCSGAAVMVKGI